MSARLHLVTNLVLMAIHERLPAASPATHTRGVRMTGLGSDVLHAWRTLVRRPLFTGMTVATLALGLGATIAMFTVADAVLLRPLPFPDDEQLVVLVERQPERNLAGAAFPAVEEWRAFPELASVAIHTSQNLLFQHGDTAERLNGASVSPEFFSTLGVRPAVGRTMQPSDPVLDPSPKMVLSDAVWRRHFGADAAVVGRHVVLEGKDYEVTGVMPPGFAYPSGAEFWTTLPASMSRIREMRQLRILETIGRMTSSASVDAVNRRLTEWKRGAIANDATGATWLPQATRLRDDVVGQVRGPLQIVFLGVAFLLLVACSNAAALVLAHGRLKLRDLAVQSALGAGRGRLVRQMLIEGLLLSLSGAAIALVIAALLRTGIIALSADQIPRVAEMTIGVRTAVFAVVVGMLTTVLVALGPALVITRRSHTNPLHHGAQRTVTSGAGRQWFGVLIAVQFALALMLASAAGLLVTSYRHLAAVDSGFSPDQVLSAKIAVPITREWAGDAPNRQFNGALLEYLRSQPGVGHAALVSRLPLSDVRGGTDLWPSEDPTRKTAAVLQLTSEGYFAAMGSQISAGRDFATTDTTAGMPVAVINDVLARQLWPTGSPIGRQVTYQYMRGPATVQVVGVVPAMRYNDLTADVRPELYVTFRQGLNTPVYVVTKGAVDAATLTDSLRAALRFADPTRSVTLTDIASLDARMSRVLARPRFYLVMVAVFAGVACLLAAVGIYGTMMFWIGERWREFGIRIALGANHVHVTRLLVRHGLSFAGAGLVVGLAAALAGHRLIASLLFQVAPSDPIVLSIVIVLLSAAAVVAAVVPARRVARVDPVSTLRAE
jgi:putative ABC transport system permease protein